jgi:hypothetical protein
MTAEAGEIVDANDYETGIFEAKGDDNSIVRGGGVAWWDVVRDEDDIPVPTDVELDRYQVSIAHPLLEFEERALTTVIDHKSQTRFNLTAKGGDNFVVFCTLVVAENGTQAEEATEENPVDLTGKFALWKKIYLEYRTTDGATYTLPIEDLNDRFKVAFVEVVEPAQSGDPDASGTALNWKYLEPEGYPESDPAPGRSNYCGPYEPGVGPGQFRHYGEGLWFFVSTARFDDPDKDREPSPLLSPGVDAEYIDHKTIRLPGATLDNTFVGALIGLNSPDGRNWAFEIEVVNPPDTIEVSPMVFFTTSESRKAEFFLDSEHLHLLTPGGDAFEDPRSVVEESVAIGVAPDLDGCSIVYSEAIATVTDDPLLRTNQTLIHEFTHGFGSAHMCGNPNHKGNQSCVMNYAGMPVLVFDSQGGFVGFDWSKGDDGFDLCAEHIRSVRTLPFWGRGVTP